MDNDAVTVDHVSISYHMIHSFQFRRAGKGLSSKSFERFFAVKDVSFSLAEGRILGIIGRNGSGKSTLLKAIAGIFSPDSGTINLHGKRVSLLSIGVGFQATLSGHDNIFLSGMLLGISKKEIERKLDEIIEFSELGDFIYKPVGTYSSGMSSKLAFSISSILDTDILLIDEILSVGDIGFKKKSFKKIHNIITDNTKTVIIVSHDEKMIREQCDQVLWMEKGNVIKSGKPDTIVASYVKFMEEVIENKRNLSLLGSHG
jgi:teichoic acid transport system ATP-binding protein